MTPEQLAVEIAKHLPKPDEDGISLVQAHFWCKVAETFTDHQLEHFVRVVRTLDHPLSKLLREMVLSKVRSEAHVQ